MKIIPLISLLICCVARLHSQAPDWIWAQKSQGTGYEDALAVTTDNLGNGYAAGYFAYDTVVFGQDTLINAGNADYYVIKTDFSGNIIWSHHAGGSAEEYAYGVSCDFNNNLIVTGTFYSDSITFGNYTLYNMSPGTPDIFIVKYDPSGTVLWAKREGTNNWDFASSVDTDPVTGEIYVAGAFYVSGIIVGSDTMTNNGVYDMLLMKFDASGNNIWARSSGGNFNDLGNAISIDASGNIYVAGGFASDSVRFGSTLLVNAYGSMPDIFTVRYDRNGNVIWARRAGANDNDHSVAVAADEYGNVYVSGHYHSVSFAFDTATLVNNGMGDIFLLKYDSTGTEIWGRTIGGTDHDFGYTLTTDPTGSVYLSGMFMSMMMQVGASMLTNASMNEDMLLVQYDPSGNVNWVRSNGGTGRDFINSISYSTTGYLYAGGTIGSMNVSLGSQVFSNSDTTLTTLDAFAGRIDIATRVVDIFDQTSFTVYPNPASLFITATMNSDQARFTVEVLQLNGQSVLRENFCNSNYAMLDIGNLPAGIYLLVMRNEETVKTVKFVKE